jgi:hypothetical protein
MAASNSAEVEKLALGAGMKKGGAAKGELVLAMYELANCFRNGWGIKKDPAAAKQYYETAANLGDTDAMNEVAWCYTEGFGTKKDKVCLLTHSLPVISFFWVMQAGEMLLGNSYVQLTVRRQLVPRLHAAGAGNGRTSASTTTPSNDSFFPLFLTSPPASFFGQQHVPHCTAPHRTVLGPLHAEEFR